jgi:hypothetical protein
MAIQRPHFAQQVDVGKLHSGFMSERLGSLPVGTCVIAAGDSGAVTRAVKKRQVRMCVTNPTKVAGTRGWLQADHTDTNQRTSPRRGDERCRKAHHGRSEPCPRHRRTCDRTSRSTRPRRLNPRREALLPVIKRRARKTIIRVAINYISRPTGQGYLAKSTSCTATPVARLGGPQRWASQDASHGRPAGRIKSAHGNGFGNSSRGFTRPGCVSTIADGCRRCWSTPRLRYTHPPSSTDLIPGPADAA